MTLVELLVVLGVIGLIVSMSVPGMVAYARRIRVKATLRQTVGLVSMARNLAIASREPHAVLVDPARRQIRVINMTSGEALEHIVRLPPSVSVEVERGGEPSDQTQFVFRPTGSLEGRSVAVVLEALDRRYVISVAATTGAVTVN